MVSYSVSAFLAISYATFFSKPWIFGGIFAGILLGGIAKEFVFAAKDSSVLGDWTSALILVGLAIYIHSIAGRIKAGDIDIDL